MSRSAKAYGNKVYVSNIDFNCSHQDVKEFFQEVGVVAFVEMLKDDNNKPNGCAIVRFKENDIAEEAIRLMNRQEMNGRRIVVKDEREVNGDNMRKNSRKRPREDDLPSVFSVQNNIAQQTNTYGLSLQFLQSLGIELPLTNRIFVANLDYAVTEDNIKEMFRLAGEVVDIELARGEDGKSKGYAFVEFDHPVEAVQAISMFHDQVYMDRPLNVQITRKERRKDGQVRLPKGLKSVGMGLGLNGAPLTDVKRAMDAGNKTGLFGAMPSGIDGNSLLPQVNVGMYNAALNTGMGIAGNMQGGAGLMSTALNSPMAIPMNSGFGNNNGIISTITGFGSNRTPSNRSRSSVEINRLPSDFTWKKLQSMCTSFGEVLHAKITSRGSGVVKFSSEAAAKRAAEMLDNQRYDGRYLETKLI